MALAFHDNEEEGLWWWADWAERGWDDPNDHLAKNTTGHSAKTIKKQFERDSWFNYKRSRQDRSVAERHEERLDDFRALTTIGWNPDGTRIVDTEKSDILSEFVPFSSMLMLDDHATLKEENMEFHPDRPNKRKVWPDKHNNLWLTDVDIPQRIQHDDLIAYGINESFLQFPENEMLPATKRSWNNWKRRRDEFLPRITVPAIERINEKRNKELEGSIYDTEWFKNF